MSERIVVEHAGGVAHVRLNRAEKRNGLDLAMFIGLRDAGRALCDDPSVRAVILSGEGKAFCAGLDWKAFLSTPDASKRLLDRNDGPANLAQAIAWVWQEVPVPVIAAIHGACFGAGLQLALGADIRIARPDAQLGVLEVDYGLVPDMGITKTLLPFVRMDVAKELTFTGRVVLGTEAQELGLVTKLSDDPLGAARELAQTIASKSPHAVRAAKSMYAQVGRLDVAAAFELETAIQMTLLGSPNQMEATMAKMQKREPTFGDVQTSSEKSLPTGD